MKLKQLILAAALAASAPLAFAHGGNYGNQGGPSSSSTIVAGGAAGFGGAAYGSANSVSQGNAAAGTEVVGNGYSIQAAGAISGGSATIGGQVTPSGATVNTSTTQYAVTGGYGSTDQVGLQNGVILNGNSAFASSTNNASGNAVFGVGAIGVIADITQISNINPNNNW